MACNQEEKKKKIKQKNLLERQEIETEAKGIENIR